MTPIDPTKPASPDPKPPAAPPYVDDDPNIDMVERGLEVAENEIRDAVAAREEESARQSESPEDALDDIERRREGDSPPPAELSSIREEKLPP